MYTFAFVDELVNVVLNLHIYCLHWSECRHIVAVNTIHNTLARVDIGDIGVPSYFKLQQSLPHVLLAGN